MSRDKHCQPVRMGDGREGRTCLASRSATPNMKDYGERSRWFLRCHKDYVSRQAHNGQGRLREASTGDVHQEAAMTNEKSDIRSVVVRGSAAGFAQDIV